jgi:hypothetical protein
VAAAAIAGADVLRDQLVASSIGMNILPAPINRVARRPVRVVVSTIAVRGYTLAA